MLGMDQAEGLRRTGASRARRVSHLRRLTDTNARAIALTSGKGGVGKTQIAANLAVALARIGCRVVLLDADLGLASLDLALGVRPLRDLRDVLAGRCSTKEILLSGPCGVHLLPACPGRYEMANLDLRLRTRLAEAVEEISRSFDVLIIDTGAGIGTNAVEIASWATEVLVLATPEPSSLRDAYAMAKVLHRRKGIDRVRVVANKVASEREGLELHVRLDEIVRRFLTLDLSYLGCVPRDESVQRAVAQGLPFVLGAPESPAARATESLARRIHADTESREIC